ncbi:unnamed protein product [Leuciscus chuanchicus]
MCNFRILNRSCDFRRCVTRPYVMAVEGSVWLRRCASHQFSRHAKQIPLSALTLDVRALNFLRGAISCKSKSCVPVAEKKAKQAVPLSFFERGSCRHSEISAGLTPCFHNLSQKAASRGFLKMDDFKSAFKRVAPRLPERTVLEAFRAGLPPQPRQQALRLAGTLLLELLQCPMAAPCVSVHLILSVSLKNSLNRWDSEPLCAVRSHSFQTVITRPRAIARSQSQYDIRQSPTKISALLSYYDVSRGFSLSLRLQL